LDSDLKSESSKSDKREDIRELKEISKVRVSYQIWPEKVGDDRRIWRCLLIGNEGEVLELIKVTVFGMSWIRQWRMDVRKVKIGCFGWKAVSQKVLRGGEVRNVQEALRQKI
jgi:hypothetical protein